MGRSAWRRILRPRGTALKDRASYQLDPARPGDAWLCAQRDADEGADILMVKPGLPYLDLLRELSREIRKPWAVYHVSGEFAALEALAAQGLAARARAAPRDHDRISPAPVPAMIITYGARFAREWLQRVSGTRAAARSEELFARAQARLAGRGAFAGARLSRRRRHAALHDRWRRARACAMSTGATISISAWHSGR